MQAGSFEKIDGISEVDETYVQGNVHTNGIEKLLERVQAWSARLLHLG